MKALAAWAAFLLVFLMWTIMMVGMMVPSAAPMILLFADRPFLLVIIYGAFGALFMPFLAVTLLMLNNSERVPAHARNGVVANLTLAGSAILFVVLAVQQVARLLS